MKLHGKSFAAGMAVGLGAFFLSTAFASGGVQSARFNNYTIYYNGQRLALNGQQMISVVKEGEGAARNYMPVRGVLEALGYTVDWDGQNDAVLITEGSGKVMVAATPVPSPVPFTADKPVPTLAPALAPILYVATPKPIETPVSTSVPVRTAAPIVTTTPLPTQAPFTTPDVKKVRKDGETFFYYDDKDVLLYTVTISRDAFELAHPEAARVTEYGIPVIRFNYTIENYQNPQTFYLHYTHFSGTTGTNTAIEPVASTMKVYYLEDYTRLGGYNGIRQYPPNSEIVFSKSADSCDKGQRSTGELYFVTNTSKLSVTAKVSTIDGLRDGLTWQFSQ